MKRNEARAKFNRAAEMVFNHQLQKVLQETGWTEAQYMDWLVSGIEPQDIVPTVK